MKAALTFAILVVATTVTILPAAEPSPPPSTGEGRGSEFRVIAPPLPAGSYHAVTVNGVRLSGIIASPGDTSFSKMPGIQATPRNSRPMPKMRTVNPGLRYERR